MTKKLTFALSALLLISALSYGSTLPAPKVSPSPVPSQVAPAVSQSCSPDECKKMLEEFKSALKQELMSLEHRIKTERAELLASQKLRMREWKNAEKDKRRDFFNKNRDGLIRREFMRDREARYSTLKGILDDEKKRRNDENDVKLKALKEDQAQRLKEFERSLALGKRPPETLWPKPGT